MAEYKPSINDAANKNWGKWVQFVLSFDQPKTGKKDDGTSWELWGASYAGAEAMDCGDKGALAPGDKCSWFLEFDLSDAWYRAEPHAKGEQVAVRIYKPNQDAKKKWEIRFADKAQQARVEAPAPPVPAALAGSGPAYITDYNQPMTKIIGTPSQHSASEPIFAPQQQKPTRPTIDDLGRTMLGCLAAARWAFEYAHLEPSVEDIRAAGVAIFIAALDDRRTLPAATDLPETGADVDPMSAPAQGAGTVEDDELPFAPTYH